MATVRTITGVNDGSDNLAGQNSGTATSNVTTKLTRNTAHKVKPTSLSLEQINDLEEEAGAQVYDTDSNVLKYFNGVEWKEVNGEGSSNSTLANRVVVNQNNFLTTICGIIDATKEYFIDGVIDIGANSITVPTNGMTITGYSFDISGLISTADNYSMFVSESEVIGSGNLLSADLYFMVTGTDSKVMNLYCKPTGAAIEFSKVNFIACSSIGDVHNYRQWLESNTGRFGGTPSLTFHGIWAGGAKITDMITRGVSSAFTGALYQVGVGFQMNNRFYGELNVDLGTNSALVDFAPSNFPNLETLQLHDCIITRNGAYDAEDSNLTPNITATSPSSDWVGNVGLPNTFIDNFTKIIKAETAPADTGVLWLDASDHHLSLYAYNHTTMLWLGEDRQYSFITPHVISPNNNFEVAAGRYFVPVSHDAIPMKIQVTMESAVAGTLVIYGSTSGTVGTFTMDGSSNTFTGNVSNVGVVDKNELLGIKLQSGSANIENSVIILTLKNNAV